MKNKKSKKFLITLLVIVVFVAGIFIGKVFSKNKQSNEQSTETTTQIVEVEVGTQTLENTLTSSGEISASSTEKISLSTSKYFNTMCVEQGDIVSSGENILEYKDGTYLTADNAEDISTTLKETQRLTKLIKELMDLARNDSKSLKLNKEHFYLDKEIESLVNLYGEAAKANNKELNLDLNYNEELFADLNKIKEVIIILLDNSLKYTENGDKIEVKTYKRDNKCVLEVIDTGIGISKEDQKHIFERFYRAEKSRTRAKGGMGLGLSIAYNVVKLHKGIIRIDKSFQKGTRMIVKLPIK